MSHQEVTTYLILKDWHFRKISGCRLENGLENNKFGVKTLGRILIRGYRL